jgi:hypothetical protein
MNDERLLTDEELRQVTALRLSGDAARSEDLAALNDAFCSLGDSLARTPPPLDQQALLQRLTAFAAAEDHHVSLRPAATEFARWRPGWLVVAGALAAAALVAIFRVPTRPASPPGVPRPDEVVNQQDSSVNQAELAPYWHDPIDEEIAIAAATMSHLSGGHRGVDASLVDMNESLWALSQELSTDAL